MNHRLAQVEKDLQDHHNNLNLTKLHQPTTIMSLSTPSKQFLNTSWDGVSATSLGSLFQCLRTLSVVFPHIQPKPPLAQLESFFPLVLSPVTSEKGPTLLLLQSPFRNLERAIRSPLSLLFPRLNSSSSFSHSP